MFTNKGEHFEKVLFWNIEDTNAHNVQNSSESFKKTLIPPRLLILKWPKNVPFVLHHVIIYSLSTLIPPHYVA